MMNYCCNNKYLGLFLFTLIVLSNCGIFPTHTESDTVPSKIVRPVEVILKPESKVLQLKLNESFPCSLYVQCDTSLIAAKFQLHYNPQLLQFLSAVTFETDEQFFETSCDSVRNPANLSLQIGNPNLLPKNRPYIIMNFRAINNTEQDSVYFEKAVYWTSLRDPLNRSVFIDKFKSLRYSIR